MSEARGFYVRRTDPGGGERTEWVGVESMGAGAFYRLSLEDGSWWLADGEELRIALDPDRRDEVAA